MAEQQLDSQGEAREALSSVVADFGPGALSDPRMLRSQMSDLLPDLPKERDLLVTAAEADVAGELTRCVREYHLDADTAVRLAAGTLMDRKAIDLTASTWVVTEYAQALGYHVQPDAPPSPAPLPPPPPPPPPQFGSAMPPTAPAAGQPFGAAETQPPVRPQPPPTQWAGGGTGPGGTGPGGTTPVGTRPGAPRPRHLVPILAASGAALVVVLYFVVAAATHVPPFSKPTSASTNGSAAPSVPLTDLLPRDIDHPATQCISGAAYWLAPGLVQALQCTDPGLPGGNILAYQTDSFANYQSNWASFNTWWGFDTSSAGPNCPPPGVSNYGTMGWSSSHYPSHQGQVLECEPIGSGNGSEPAYAWTFPTENAFIVAQAAGGTPFDALASWWANAVGG